ncbi:MAG: hypothetical protein ABI891_04735, partial [Acidobacteriota bacterium]
MKAMNIKWRNLSAVLLLSLASSFFGVSSQVLAHGGEDHGDEKPKAPTTTAGTISRTARLGDVEILLKHPLLEPDTAATARLFITKFATNEPFGDVNSAVEIESANGGLATEIAVEKTEAGGSYVLKIPAFPEGAYTIRVKANVGGKTDTATFSGVEIAHQQAAAANSGGSWLQTVLTAFLFL